MDEAFGEVRAAVHGGRDADGFARVFDAMRDAFDVDAEAAERVAMPYAREALASWPDEARRVVLGEAPGRWSGCARALSLARELGVSRVHHPSSSERAMWVDRVLTWWGEHAAQLRGLRAVNLSEVRLTPTGVIRFVDAGDVPGLRRVQLVGTRTQSAGLWALARADWAGRLEALDVSRCRIARGGVQRFVQTGSMSGLVELDFGNNPMDGGAAYLGADRVMTSLERLRLPATQSRDDLFDGLVRLGGHAPLRHLDVSANRLLTGEALARFARSEVFSRLRSWSSLRIDLPAEAVGALLEGAASGACEELEVSGACVSVEACRRFAGWDPELARRFVLDVDRASPLACEALCGGEWISSLEHLSLRGVEPSWSAIRRLAGGIRRGRLQELRMYGSNLSDDDGIALMEACVEAKIPSIQLGGNPLGARFCQAVASMDLGHVVYFDVARCPIGLDGLEALASAATWTSLVDFRAGWSGLSVEERSAAFLGGGGLPDHVLKAYGIT